ELVLVPSGVSRVPEPGLAPPLASTVPPAPVPPSVLAPPAAVAVAPPMLVAVAPPELAVAPLSFVVVSAPVQSSMVVCRQPSPLSQASLVHGSASSQSIGACVHPPREQSSFVQASPSSQFSAVVQLAAG